MYIYIHTGPNSNGVIVIWNVEDVGNDATEIGAGRVVCQLTGHMGCVNCVRWNAAGDRPASSSDDHSVMIWQCAGVNPRSAQSTTSSSFGALGSYPESWRCFTTLQGHTGGGCLSKLAYILY